MDKERLFLYFDRAIMVCLCLLIFCLPFTNAGVESFVWLAIFLWIFKRVLRYRADSFWGMFPKTELNKALGIFIAINAVSMIFTADLGLSLRGFFGKELKFLAIYFMMVEAINNRKRLKNVLIVIIASVMLITVDAGVQLFRGVDFLRGRPIDMFSASFYTATGFSGWLVVIMFLFLGLLITNKIMGNKIKVLLFILILIDFLCLLRTHTRGAWLGFAVGSCLMLHYSVKNSALKIKILCLFLAMCLLWVFLPQSIKAKSVNILRSNFKCVYIIGDRIKSISQMDTASNLIRIYLWKEALMMIKDYPLTGCGLNTYSIVARNYKSFDEGGVYPHNSYLQMAAETGLLGLFAFLWVLFTFFKTGLRYFNRRKNSLVLGLLAGILAFLVHAFFDTHLYSLQLVVLFWFMLGLTVAVINIDRGMV